MHLANLFLLSAIAEDMHKYTSLCTFSCTDLYIPRQARYMYMTQYTTFGTNGCTLGNQQCLCFTGASVIPTGVCVGGKTALVVVLGDVANVTTQFLSLKRLSQQASVVRYLFLRQPGEDCKVVKRGAQFI